MGLIEKLKNAIIEGNEESATQIAKRIVEEKTIDIQEAILKGLSEGMKIVGKKYKRHEYFIPEIIISADALNIAFDIFKPHLKVKNSEYKATIVAGVVKGDIHEIGKNILVVFLTISGYNVIDLGRNVHVDNFISAIQENHADVLCLSTLMTPTLEEMSRILEKIKEKDLKNKVKVMIGGAPTNQEFAEQIGADFYCKDANEAVRVLNNFFLNK